jgi:hypothetical protein
MASDVAPHSELDLPKELWIEIVLEIDPRDAVALSQVRPLGVHEEGLKVDDLSARRCASSFTTSYRIGTSG